MEYCYKDDRNTLTKSVTISFMAFTRKLPVDKIFQKNFQKIVFISLITIVGVIALTASKAASPAISIEAESGVLSGNISISGIDATASANRSAVFDTSSSVQTGTWTNVTPSGMDLLNGSCDNYGANSVVANKARQNELFIHVDCQGIWKSTNYGQTWTGPINTGQNGAQVSDCAGGINIAPASGNTPATLYESCIRGSGQGFWRSTDGGINWTKFILPPGHSNYQDVYAPDVDPYDGNHLIMAWHEWDTLLESTNGGQTWTYINTLTAMHQNGGTAALVFINTGNPSTTRTTWLYVPQDQNGAVGTWRTIDGGANWTHVDKNEKPHGSFQIFQPDTNGTLFIGGSRSDLGQGVLRSSDYGQTWVHVGNSGPGGTLFGSPNHVYNMYSWACKLCVIDPNFQGASILGITGWMDMTVPSQMILGPATVATVYDGSHYIYIGGNWNIGIWRYVEP
jgi:hypothetical protein